MTYAKAKMDYQYIDDVFSPDSEMLADLKRIITTRLTEAEKVLIILYAEMGSIRAVSKSLGIARSTLYGEIQRIKKKIVDALPIDEYIEHCGSDSFRH